MSIINGLYQDGTANGEFVPVKVDNLGQLQVSVVPGGGSMASTITNTYQYRVINAFTDANAGLIQINSTLKETAVTDLSTGNITSDFWTENSILLASAPNRNNITALTTVQEVSGPSGSTLALDSSIQNVITAINSQTGTLVALDPQGTVANTPAGVTGTLVDIIRNNETGTISYKLYATNTDYIPVGTLEPFIVAYGSVNVISSELPTGAAKDSSLASIAAKLDTIHEDLVAENATLTTINTGIGSTINAVNAVATAAQTVQTSIDAGNVSEATIASQTATLTTALTDIQTLINGSNTALGVLHTDGINLQALVTAGNISLSAIQNALGFQATAANQTAAITALGELNTAAESELTALNTIASNITALGATLGAGKTLSDIVAALNADATPGDIIALQAALTTLENATNAKLDLVNQTLAQIHADLTTTNADLTSINTSVGNLFTAINNVLTAVNAVNASVQTDASNTTTIAGQTASLTSALANLQTLINSGNTSIGVLHADGLNLQSLASNGNAALLAIDTLLGSEATAANQELTLTALSNLNTLANNELAKVDAIASNITALGTTLGAGKTLADVVAAVNSEAKPSDIAALQSALTALNNAGNSSLASLDSKIPALGQSLASQSVPVVLPASQVAELRSRTWNLTNISDSVSITSSDLGLATDAPATTDTGTFSLISLFKRNLQKLTSLSSLLPTSIGQKNKAGSFSVTLASDQNNALETGGKLESIDTKLPPQGQALASSSLPVVLPASQVTALTPPSNTGYALDGTDATGVTPVTGGVGIRGWLSSIYAKLSSSIAITATALPLPAGAALESGGNLASINTGINNISGLYTPKADSIYPTYGTTSDQYVYKLSGVTVLTRTINYTDSTKSFISSITQG